VSRCSAVSCGPEVFGSPNLTHTMACMLFIIGETDSLFRPSLFHECDGILKSRFLGTKVISPVATCIVGGYHGGIAVPQADIYMSHLLLVSEMRR
jgi:hypothetical protein